MPAEVPRLFVFARHAESEANSRRVMSCDPSEPVPLTARGRAEARSLGGQLVNVHIDLAVATRHLRTQQTAEIALHGRPVPVLIEPGFDELRAGDLDGAPMEAYWAWKHQHTPEDRPPHGESVDDALRRYAGALRRLLARTEPVTLVVLHEIGLHHIVLAAAPDPSALAGTTFENAVPYLLDDRAAERAAAALETLPAAT